MESILLVILIALLGGVITAVLGVFRSLSRKISETADRTTYIEAKMDIYLDIAGLDVQKVNGKIKDHIAELMQNGRPSVGCINVKELYKTEQGG